MHQALVALCLALSVLAPARALVSEWDCCREARGYCLSVCQKLSLVAISSDIGLREKCLNELNTSCPTEMVDFWKCVNSTLKVMTAGDSWFGRICCGIPFSEKCQYGCAMSTSREELTPVCRHSDELSFFTCLDHQQIGDRCCRNAKSDECRQSCQSIFKSQRTPGKRAREQLAEDCKSHSPRVLQCVWNITKVTASNNTDSYMHCCDKGKGPCRETCRRILRSKSTDQEIFDGLQEGGCGTPDPSNKIWQCFLQRGQTHPSHQVSRIDIMGMDAAKLHCCNRVSSQHCRSLCIKKFSKDLDQSWKVFDLECLNQPSEVALSICINEVEEPCELGCSGMGFCTNFNNRPTELFRACASNTDDAARHDAELWQIQGFVSLPGLTLRLRNSTSTSSQICSPQLRKAVACAMQIRPCQRDYHGERICRNDCIELVDRCADWSQMTGHPSSSAICDLVSTASSPCVPLSRFLEPSGIPYMPPGQEVTSPCRGDPCPVGELCIPNRDCGIDTLCKPYSCVPGCKLGEVSRYLVPQETFVLIPMISGGQRNCFKICKCTNSNIIEQCQALPCVSLDRCWIGNRKIDHGDIVYIDCNVCSCFSGELSCSKKQCEMTSAGGRDLAFTSLPCNCPPHFEPVCGVNGKTYPNSCLAKCSGLSAGDFHFGECAGKNPCDPNPCSSNEICIPKRQICLAPSLKNCPQIMCLNLNNNCSTMSSDLVCDSDNITHNNPCFLHQNNSTLAYWGHCITECRASPVCGADGNSYPTSCAARARRVPVDYEDHCQAVGLISKEPWAQCWASGVVCPRLVRQGCVGITPPGACCPVCGGAVRFLFSREQMDRSLNAIARHNQARSDLFTVETILKDLERFVPVAECTVRGYLSIEQDLFVLIRAETTLPPSDLQLEACVREAEKLAALVRLKSPRLLSHLSLSSLISSFVVHMPVHNLSTSSFQFAHHIYSLLSILLIIFVLS